MRVRRYETVFVLRPDLEEQELRDTVSRFEQVLTRQAGTLIKREDWGIRKLAYDVKRFSKGYYVILDYIGPTTLVSELERNMKINEKVMKFLTVKKADKIDMEAIEKEKLEAARRREEAARRAAASREVVHEELAETEAQAGVGLGSELEGEVEVAEGELEEEEEEEEEETTLDEEEEDEEVEDES